MQGGNKAAASSQEMLWTDEDEWPEAQRPLSQRRTTETAALHYFRPGTVKFAPIRMWFSVTADSKGLKEALLTSSETKAVPQAAEVVSEPQEQGLADLHGHAVAGAREESFRLITEKTASILARCPFSFAEGPGTSDNEFPRGVPRSGLAAMMLRALQRCRMYS